MKYYLNSVEVDILETNYDDGVIQVVEAYFMPKNDSKYGTNLTQEECEVLEAQYQDSLLADYYGNQIDCAQDAIEDNWID